MPSAVGTVDPDAAALESAPASRSPAEIVDEARAGGVILQDFRPIAESLDWELGQLYYKLRGSQVFLSGEVPFLVNNDGFLSANAAEVFFQNLADAECAGAPETPIVALELGAGLGLFARYFLDAFRGLCLQHGKSYYDRFCYCATDGSERMIADLFSSGVLDPHAGHYRLAVVDALRSDLSTQPPGVGQTGLHAVFLTYMLDCLPATVLRLGGEEVSELCVRTRLARGMELQEYTPYSIDEIRQRATSGDRASKEPLLDLYRVLCLEYQFRALDLETLPHGDWVRRLGEADRRYALHSYGALGCLGKLLGRLREDGFILLSDYGHSGMAFHPDASPYQRYGGSTQIGVNFWQLKAYFTALPGCLWVEPDEDNESIFVRLLGRRPSPAAVSVFRERFQKAVFQRKDSTVEASRGCLKEGRYQAGLEAYREALLRQPNNWVLLGEVARFLMVTLQQPGPGLELAQKALSINPTHPDLWNTLGDALFALARHEEAQQAFQRALRFSPGDVRARYNLVYTLVKANDLPGALKMVAEGLAYDETAEYRERLLERQSEILGEMARRRQQKQRVLADRSGRIEPLPE